MREATVCLLVRGDPPTHILLGFKKAGFGAGKYAGFGGKIRPSEDVDRAAARELEEETGLRAVEEDLQPMGELRFVFPARPAWSQIVHVFLVTAWDGEPAESAEMLPGWFEVDQIPFEHMWQDGVYWLPCILARERIRARFTFAEDNETVAGVEIGAWE
jgi:8-oxo-dGTP pyrophosphatase MutT (NUDIX family)